MPASDSPSVIVARFLKSNNYTDSYDTFIAEAGLPADAGTVSKGDLTLETLLEEKRTFDLSQQFEKLGADDASSGWSRPAPSISNPVSTLPTRSNILSVSAHHAVVGEDASASQVILVSTASRHLHVLDATTASVLDSHAALHDSPILSATVHDGKYLLTASMSGQLLVSELDTADVLSKRHDHSKYLVQVATYAHGAETLIATAGWDCKVTLYRARVSASHKLELGEPTASIILPSKPESILFIEHPDTAEPILLLSRTDSSFLYYYTTTSSPQLLGRQNLAPHSNAWVAFTPSSLAQHPTDPTLIAVGTSTVPHMKLLIVRLLVPPNAATSEGALPQASTPARVRSSILDDPSMPPTQASQARGALAIADRESAAILINCTTLAPQTAYSTPAVVWRPDGSGVWVNGDDGAVRGVEASSGKVVATLLGGHEAGSKVRCLWAGHVEGDGAKREVLVSGGFDRRLIFWKVAEGA